MTGALPVGNGALGGMAFGTLASERLQFNEKTLRTGGPGAAGGCDFGNWRAPRPGAVADVRRRLDERTTLTPEAAAWLTAQLYDHYRFSGSTDFLRTTAHPVMKEATGFWLDSLHRPA